MATPTVSANITIPKISLKSFKVKKEKRINTRRIRKQIICVKTSRVQMGKRQQHA